MFLERHYLLLAPTERVTMEKRKLGPYIPDFVLRFPDGTISFVEIQLNRDPILLNDEPSDGMKEAVEQVGNWFNWLKEHSHSEVVRASGLIVIGRRISYMKHNKKIENLLRRFAYPVRLLTYDDLGDSVKKILELLS